MMFGLRKVWHTPVVDTLGIMCIMNVMIRVM